MRPEDLGVDVEGAGVSDYDDATAELIDWFASMMDREPAATFTNLTVRKSSLHLARLLVDKAEASMPEAAEVEALERLYAQRARRRDHRHPTRPESEAA